MLSGLTAKTLGRYQDATEMIEKSMERLASGKADISSADKVKLGRINIRFIPYRRPTRLSSRIRICYKQLWLEPMR